MNILRERHREKGAKQQNEERDVHVSNEWTTNRKSPATCSHILLVEKKNSWRCGIHFENVMGTETLCDARKKQCWEKKLVDFCCAQHKQHGIIGTTKKSEKF